MCRDKGALAAAVAGACAQFLTPRLDPYLSLQIRYGLVALTVNGYRMDNTDLHNLIVAADGVANALSALPPPASNTPFTTLGPAVGTAKSAPGVPPGTSAPCRLVWFEQGGRTSGSVRGGVIRPAVSGATTPLGGALNEQTGMYEGVVDGMVSCWRKQRSVNALETNEIVTAAIATLRASGRASL